MITTPLPRVQASYDVVVIGSGAAGLVAALRTADAGLSVLVLEKAERLGGTSAISGGVMWAPDSHLMHDAGFADSAAAAADYLRAATNGSMPESEIDWYVTQAPRAVRYLADNTRVRQLPLARPDYHLEWPGAAAAGRGLDNAVFDPAEFSGLAETIREASYFPPISMGERDDLRGAPIDAELLHERTQAGIRTMGGALVGSLVASALDRDIDLVLQARVTGLQPEGDRWRLVIDGGAHSVHSVSADQSVSAGQVVIASGGFEWNRQLREALLSAQITPISAPSNEGDGLVLGLSVGAGLSDATSIWGVPVIAAPTQNYDGHPSGRMANVEMTLPGSITVNARGRRFVNEALNYHDLTRVFSNTNPATGRPANSPAWLIFDSGYLDRYPVAGSTPGQPEPWMLTADTLAGLAELCSISPEGLVQTVVRFNAGADLGRDDDFGRGATAQDRYLGDPNNLPNPCLAPLVSAPYYAVPIRAGVLGTAGGLRANEHGQVLTHAGDPISGLFAAGNCSATVFHDAYPGGGATLGSAITRAFAVGEFLAAHSTH
ncbi:FAD-dependent oxidoreductase [Cryobacterium frigoriphilum]|uniref:FAD-dependent oxidoreductase n=1 Tax=Cryobacterium frigoriphilum TaxID=1259150 RepID=A0A4R9A984_9MICO|nr:FAD-dependent oxidoreductase [Cryobacterium frigoriphilum]TFD54471.1 FAD-dependent oxidoreductase [Cryobacterium frigoriphilum]